MANLFISSEGEIVSVLDLAGTIASIGASLLSSARDGLKLSEKTKKKDGPPTGDAKGAAEQFLAANLRLLRTTETIYEIGTPPNVLGALWSWPYVISAVKRLPELGTEAVVALGVLLMMSESGSLDRAAVEIAIAVGGALEKYPHVSKRQRTSQQDQDFREGIQNALLACGRFVAVVQTGKLPPEQT